MTEILTSNGHRERTLGPVVDEDGEEGRFGTNDGDPTCYIVNSVGDGKSRWIVYIPSHSAKPAPNASAGSTQRPA